VINISVLNAGNFTMSNPEYIKRVNALIKQLKELPGAEHLYIFSPYFKPLSISLSTDLGAIFNFSNWEDFSESKIGGFKQLVGQYNDIITGYVRIGNSLYKAGQDHNYNILTQRSGKSIIDAVVGKAVKVSKFDISMLDPKWLEQHGAAEVTEDSDQEVYEDEEEYVHNVSQDPDDAVRVAMEMLHKIFGECDHNDLQLEEMEEMLQDAVAPFHIELTPSKDGIQIVGQNNVGIALYNNDGQLWWEF
jgi:hypothetical protein